MNKETRSYGSWPSKISVNDLVKDAVKLAFPKTVGEDLYWQETRPSEKGRSVIVKNGMDLLPNEYSARTRAQEYGGNPYLVVGDQVYFSNAKDQKLYCIKDGKVSPFTQLDKMRYADGVYNKKRELFYYVREDHNEKEVQNTIVCIDLKGEEKIVCSGADFYSNPRISPDGKYFTYLCWNHPNMPWDHVHLVLHEIKNDGLLQDGELIAGDDPESIFDPKFGPDGALYFVSDRSGYWNLYRFSDNKVLALHPEMAEFGLPAWIFGFSTYDFLMTEDGYDIICSYIQKGEGGLARLSLKDFSYTTFDIPHNSFNDIHVSGQKIYFTSGAPDRFSELVCLDARSHEFEVIKKSMETDSLDVFSVGQPVSFYNDDEDEVYGFFYPPVSAKYHGPDAERPPLIVKVHGGPTGMSANVLNMEIQFWTSRGFAYGLVNFGGSTGYGREYRERLTGKLGIVDVNDTCSFALHLVKEGLVDGDRTAIKGGSSGGYTTLAALAFRDVFQVGVSAYGISDLEILAKETHKFEERYTDGLIGPYPEMKKVYKERSPIHAVNKIKVPVLLLQGSDDKVVLPNQSEMIFEKLKEKGIPTKFVLFEGEGHGFRQAENIKQALLEEQKFYSEIFGLDDE